MTNRSAGQIERALKDLRSSIVESLSDHGVAILPPMDVHHTLNLAKALRAPVRATVLDPWYNKGVGGVRDDYIPYVLGILEEAKAASSHLFLWGFPEIIAPFVERIPRPLTLVAWLTWYFKNNPSVIRGWRSAQMTCLHLSNPGARMYVEHFLNEAQLAKQAEGKLRYMPGPPSVIEDSLLVGFVGKKEQTGHPSQKPVRVIERILMMATEEDDLVLDPMSGSGTTGEAARNLGRLALICDHSEEYTCLAEKRLNARRVDVPHELLATAEDGVALLASEWPRLERPALHGAATMDSERSEANQMAFFETPPHGRNGSSDKPGRSPKRRRSMAGA